jgi:hypothetical protein
VSKTVKPTRAPPGSENPLERAARPIALVRSRRQTGCIFLALGVTMRRAMTVVGCAVLMLALAACDATDRKTEDPPVSPAQPVGSLCERVLPTMRGSWKAEDGEAGRGGQPLSDSCWLIDGADAKHRIRISVSVLPMTAEDLAKVRDTDSFYASVRRGG